MQAAKKLPIHVNKELRFVMMCRQSYYPSTPFQMALSDHKAPGGATQLGKEHTHNLLIGQVDPLISEYVHTADSDWLLILVPILSLACARITG